MIKLIKTPNLPVNSVKHCLIGENNTEEIFELSGLGIECIQLKTNNLLDNEINCHADLLSFNFGNGQVIASKGSIGEDVLKRIGITKLLYIDSITSPYPNDIPLNAAFIGNSIICKVNATASKFIEFAKANKLNIINTKQGYARCNLCIVSDNAVITEDCGLACLLKKYQLDVLTITSGDVYLSEKHYGFLGGASCKLSNNEIFFSGNIEKHRNYTDIINFLNKHNVKPIYNKNRFLRDFGGIIQLTEEK